MGFDENRGKNPLVYLCPTLNRGNLLFLLSKCFETGNTGAGALRVCSRPPPAEKFVAMGPIYGPMAKVMAKVSENRGPNKGTNHGILR